MIIVGILLINIFLAILVDAYMEVRSKSASQKGLAEDFMDVATHSLKWLFFSKSIFMSDWELHSRLRLVLNHTKQTSFVPQQGKVLQLVSDIIQRGDRMLHLPGGIEITRKTLSVLGKELSHDPLKSCVTPFSVDASMPEEEEEPESWVDDVIDRYAEDIDAEKLEASVVADVSAENLKRELFTYRAHQKMHDAVIKIDALLETLAGKVLSPQEMRATREQRALSISEEVVKEEGSASELLRVTIVHAEALPRKDLFRSVDCFCLVCMVFPGQDPTARQTFKTRVDRRAHV